MVFNFRIVSDEVDNFRREIQIDARATCLVFKNAICEATKMDKNDMSSFFICDDDWEKEKEITSEDMGSDSDTDIYLMEDTTLEELIDDEGQKLLFVFDYFTDRALFIELKQIITGRTLQDPLCTLAIGNAPAQHIDMQEFDAKLDAKVANTATLDDFDDDTEFYGSEGYDPEELADDYEEITDIP